MTKNHIHSSTAKYIANNEIALGYDQCFAAEPLFKYDVAQINKWFDNPEALIDLGCGTGRHVIPMAKIGHKVTALDLSAKMLAVTQHKLKCEKLSATLYHKDICDLDAFDDNSFRHALCMFSTFGMIYGATARHQFLRSIKRILKPSGQLVLHLHNRHHSIWTREGLNFLVSNYIQTKQGKAELGDKFMPDYRGIKKMYLHLFTKDELIDALTAANLHIVDFIELNQNRSGPLKVRFLRKHRCNGFLIRVENRNE
jgi:ubiquinone/menaquinone biosynthesis C-methylase UbiE